MSKKDLPIDIGDLELFQLGYVYKDIQKQIKIMEKIWNVPKFWFLGEADYEIINRGVESVVTLDIALSRYWGKQIELIQWISGEGIYKEFIEQGKEGLHHLSCMVDELDPYIELFKENGFEPLLTGVFVKQYVAYFDTIESLGFILEIQTTLKRKKKK